MPTKFTKKDFGLVAQYVVDEYKRRKNARGDSEKLWKDIDRQKAMIPEVGHKLNAAGEPDPQKAWLPESELPLQAECLEVLTADARRLQFPDSGDWFCAHACMTDAYIRHMEGESIIAGDEMEVPSLIDQDNADKLVQGAVGHWQRQYDFYGNMDVINAEAFSYGMGLGRARLLTKSVFLNKAKGVVRQTQEIPVLVPVSIKNTYLDDRAFALMGEGFIVGPAHIFYKKQHVEDLRMAATKGGNDPDNMKGGWVANVLKGFQGDKQGQVELLEYEGDLIVPKSQGSIFQPNVIVTVVIGEDVRVVRVRFNKKPYTSYIEFPYHVEGMESAYPTSPLMKGWPIQKAAVDALNRLLMVCALHAAPPIGYDKDDQTFASRGGPNIHPFAKWGTLGDLKVHEIGDPQAMKEIYFAFLQQYADVTGITAPRLGAQTISHTTAYSKQVELNRGTVRTVDYVNTGLKGGLAQWLYKAYDLGRSTLTKRTTMYIAPYGGFVDIDKSHLPEEVMFEAYGSGGPDEEKVKADRKLQSLMQAIQLDQLVVQQGGKPNIDVAKAQESILREGGWTDTSVLKSNLGTTALPPQAAAAIQALSQPQLLTQ